MIVGDGAVLEDLKAAAQAGGLDNIIFTGRQPKESIPEFLAASDTCLVHLKKREIFTTVMPSKIFEACAMSRPIILGVQGFAAEFLRKSGGGICMEPENEDDLILAAEHLRNEPGLATRLGGAGRDYVLHNFDRDKLAETYLNRIKMILSPGRSGNLRLLMFGNLDKYIVVFLTGLLGTYILTPLVRSLALRYEIVDLPDARRPHRRPTPRGGGLAVVLGVHMACLMALVFPWPKMAGGLDLVWYQHFTLASLLLLVVGMVDDVHGLGYLGKTGWSSGGGSPDLPVRNAFWQSVWVRASLVP